MLTNSVAYTNTQHGIQCKMNLHHEHWQIICTGVGVDKDDAFLQALKHLIQLTTLNTEGIIALLDK
jgi:hypothetical protein